MNYYPLNAQRMVLSELDTTVVHKYPPKPLCLSSPFFKRSVCFLRLFLPHTLCLLVPPCMQCFWVPWQQLSSSFTCRPLLTSSVSPGPMQSCLSNQMPSLLLSHNSPKNDCPQVKYSQVQFFSRRLHHHFYVASIKIKQTRTLTAQLLAQTCTSDWFITSVSCTPSRWRQ